MKVSLSVLIHNHSYREGLLDKTRGLYHHPAAGIGPVLIIESDAVLFRTADVVSGCLMGRISPEGWSLPKRLADPIYLGQ